ncbi:MAG: exonuclease SbcCD subunit D [Ruminiclostridium sp.]|nr:exonuclease SbcCD subunit D [Ruminiclostridium sp.]MBQ9932387.1 exonuclease SbcCD subunit D [Ruminiclostridium sp.]
MKLLHCSDLHIGKRVNEFSMLEDQRYILNQISELALLERVDAVLLAGDLYDKPIPPAEAVGLLDEFLTGLARAGIQVLAISGNHDSPERLSFAARLMEDQGVHLAALYRGAEAPVVLADEHGPVNFYLLPYLKPALVRHVYPEAEIASYEQAVKYAVDQWQIDPGSRNVLVAHQFVLGGSTCESEELSVGGLDQISAQVFERFDYVALGHLHGPQKIGRETLRYSGSPLKYSFSEAGHEKSVCLVEMGEKGRTEVRLVPLKPLRDLREVRGTYEQVTAKSFYDGTNTRDYLHITLTDEEDVPEAMGRLRAIYPNLMKLTYDNKRTQTVQEITGAERPEERTPLELFRDLYELQNNQPMSREQEDFLTALMEEIWEGRS